MLEFIYLCMMLALKVFLGTLFWVVVVILLIGLSAVIICSFAYIFGWTPPKEPPKKPETWQEWKEKQDGELKTLLNEIDKDLEDEPEN